ncbi:14203_t:CDS:10 [Entrophospora sp. SA101]|nr:14203_t:CDS:10 [Entrophospora sp. SA101]
MTRIPLHSIKSCYNLLIITIIIFSFVSYSQQLETTIEDKPQIRKRDYDKRFYYAIEVANDLIITPKDVENLLNIKHEGRIGELDNYHLFSSAKEDVTIEHYDKRFSHLAEDNDRVLKRFNELRELRKGDLGSSTINKRSLEIIDGILSVDKQILRKRHKRVPLPPPTPSPTDNSHKFLDPDEIGHDINVTGIWKEGITGKGVVAAIVDDGLDMYSEDLADNFYAEGSYDFNDHNPLPKPRLIDDTHGTRCAGEIAAVKNSVCGIGIAPDVKIADADEAEALNYKFQKNDIYSCSWGPPDDGQSAEAPQGVILKAIVKGIEKGRGGKGSLFVFASGNGGANDDNCNYDGYTNSIYTLTVGAVDRKHVLPYYAERCTALLITTYSSGSGSYIYTTDVGVKKCTNLHGGTSAAAPIAAGVFSLVLQIRPDLTWRDMQYLVLNSAMTFNLEDPDWQLTKAGRLYNYKFGYGKLDAYTLIQNAKTYKLLNPQVNIEMPIINVTKPIPMNQEGIISKVVVKKSDVDKANMKRLEHVTVTINVIHERRGDIEVDLISPNGIVSTIGLPRMYDENIGGLNNWTFMSVKHWLVRNPKFNGIFVDWMLKLWGERTDNNESGKNSSDTNNNSDKTSTTIITNTTPSSIADDDNNKISTSTIPSSPPVNDDDNKISTTNNPISTETQPATTNAADNNNDDSSSSSSNSINSNWIWGIGVVMAFTLAYMVYATRKWYWDDVKKIVSEVFSRRTYASVLRQPSDRTSNDEDGDLIPLTRGNKQFTTSRELK